MNMLKYILIVISTISVVGYFAGKSRIGNLLSSEIFGWIGAISTIMLVFVLLRQANFSISTRTYINIFGTLAGIITGTFGIWGAFSDAGKKRYDEMAGIIPYGAMAFAGIVLTILIVINIIWLLKSQSK